MFFCSCKVEKYLEKSGKRSNLVLGKSGRPLSDFCTNPVLAIALNIGKLGDSIQLPWDYIFIYVYSSSKW